VEVVLYLVDNGCKWRALPHDYPKWSSVKSFYYRALENNKWEKVMSTLVARTRKLAGRNESPSYAIIDSQSVKTNSSNDERGFDGGKKVKGRKRHIAVDVMGNLLAVSVHAANIHDTISGIMPARKAFEKYPSIEHFFGDDGYRKTFVENILTEFGLGVDITKQIKGEF
jgi:putative transposase